MKEKPIVSHFPVYDNLQPTTRLPIREHYDRMVDRILLPYQTGKENIGLSEETVNIIFGKLMAGKSDAALQLTLKLASERRIKEALQDKGKTLTSILLPFDPLLRLSKWLIFGMQWEDRATAGAYAWASLGLINEVDWIHNHIPRPYVIIIDAAVFPYDSLPYSHPRGGRDVGGSAVEEIAHLEYLNVFGTAILPNKEREKRIAAERLVLTDASLTESVKIKANESARRKAIELRKSMASQEAIETVEEIIFARFDQLIDLRVLPDNIQDFRSNPAHEREAYLLYYTLECESLFGPDGEFRVVNNPDLPHEIEEPTYEEEIKQLPIIPTDEIFKATIRSVHQETGTTEKEPFFRVKMAPSEKKVA